MENSNNGTPQLADPWVSPDRSICKQITHPGEGLYTPNEGSIVTVCIKSVHIPQDVAAGQLYQYDCGNIEITLGFPDTWCNENIEKCIESMKPGEVCEVCFSRDHKTWDEFKDDEASKVVLRVTLKSVQRCTDLWEREPELILQMAQKCKDNGSRLFKEGNLEYASKHYSKALKYLIILRGWDVSPELNEKIRSLSAVCYTNISLCLLRNGSYENVVRSCDKALEINPQDVKALFRRAKANTELKNYDDAKMDLAKAEAKEPGNPDVKNLKKIVEERLKNSESTIAAGMRKMFGS
ncbi:FK506-binding protein-like [Lingula anatina]|uniref:FK506-binding protein-like n=1 Tax=Lingula anatina TaxID=7574 RepID=A0A1S3JRE7_LINAN|nr:FK506-binding protein-like [Lingula anatina]|eukprot:XP_013412666.1 FK506-binding protein-like [Lingula anatina]